MPRARKSPVAGLSPTSKNVAALFTRREGKLNDEHKEYPKRPCEADEALADVRRHDDALLYASRGNYEYRASYSEEPGGTRLRVIVREL